MKNDKFADIAASYNADKRKGLVVPEPIAISNRVLYLKRNDDECFDPVGKIENRNQLKAKIKDMRSKYSVFLADLAPGIEPVETRIDIKEFEFCLNGGSREIVKIPHYGGPCGDQTAFYETDFALDSFDGKNVVLCFKGVDYIAEVFVNGIFVGSHEGFFSPFEFDVTSAVKVGNNRLKVIVKNMEKMQFGGDKIYAATGLGWNDPYVGWHHCPAGLGIYNKVFVELRNSAYITDIFPRTTEDVSEIQIETSGTAETEDYYFEVSVYGQNFRHTEFENYRFVPATNAECGLNDTFTEAIMLKNGTFGNAVPLKMSKGFNRFVMPFKIKSPKLWDMLGYKITSIPTNPDSAVNESGDAWNSKTYTNDLSLEDSKVLVKYTVSINWAKNTATVAFSKPAADGVEGSYDYALSGSKAINFTDFQDVYFAVSAGKLGNGPVYVTDIETTYEREYVSDEWIKEVNPNTADAEKVLSYTAADGQTVMEPVVTNIAGANAVTWNSKSTTGASGENHQRINIASEKNGLPLVSFSFKSLVVTDNGSATPVYILFGSNEDKTKQTAVALGGCKGQGYLSYVAKELESPATGSVNGSTSLFNKNATGKYTDVTNQVAAEIGKEYYRFTVKLYGNIAKITAENLDAEGNVEWSGELQKDIDLSAVANPYYAISSGWETTAKPVYVTDIQPIYAEPEMLGATIRKDASASEQDIMFGSQIKIADSIADGYTPAGYGMLLARTADIQGAAMTADAENVKVTNLYREAGEDTDFLYCVTINKSAIAGNTGKKFSARSYVKYVKAGADDIYVYSEQIAKSVYGYAKDMAADVIASGKVEATYEVAGATVNYVAENITAVMNGKSADISFDGTNKNEDHLLAFIYANREYNA